MCRMFDKTLNSVNVYNYKLSKTCRKVSARELVRRNVHWFHQHNKHYILHTKIYKPQRVLSPSGTASLEFFFTLLWRRFRLQRLVATVMLTLTVLVNVVAMSPSNNRRLSVQLLQLPTLNLRYLRCSATFFHISHSGAQTKWYGCTGGCQVLRALHCGEMIIEERQELER